MKRILPAAFAAFALLALPAARADIVPGLEAYGDLTLVDEVVCATDTEHEFHQHTDDATQVETILGSSCLVLPHQSGNAGFFSFRLGKDKGLVAHDMYLLVVEYPDDVPRTATLINRAMNSRNGFHTGISVGETLTAHIIGQTHPESMNVPLSGTYKQIEQVMFLNENVFPYNSTSSYIDSESNGFDVIFHVFQSEDAPDSAGAAIRAIKLYRMNDESGLATPVRYPSGDAPKRHITWRDEMGKHNAYSSNADKFDNFRMKMRLMKELGVDTWSRDLLEFGYNQYWDVTYANNGNSNWFYQTDDYWTTEIGIYADAGIYLLPFYEYAGSRGPGGLGVNSGRKAVQLFRGGYGGHFNLFVANANGASGANVDITDDAAYTDFAAILDCTILRYKDQANFLGAWIRNRGSMPVSFSENTRNRFCADTGRTSGSVSMNDLSNVDEYGDEAYRYICQMMKKPELYQEYRTWWNGKRADWLKAMQQHLVDGGLSDAKVYFSGVWGEAGWELQNLAYYRDYFNRVAAEDKDAWTALSGSSSTMATIGEMSSYYTHYGIDNDSFTWFPDEYNHAAPRNDPETYTNVSDVAICYPYNCVYTTIPSAAATYRNATGDLFFSRHFCLYEGCGNGVDYFTTEMDRCGRAIMLPELHAMAYQDPTIIGFMQGGHLARNFTKEFRDFNEHFLSLPAVQGTVLWGGGWGVNPYTIRKYVTDDATYYAIINPSSQSFDNSWKYLSDESGTFTLYDTVSGETLTCGNGYARFTLEPYQMKVYSTEAPKTPRFLVAVPAVGSTTADIPLAVTTLGGSSATLTVRYSTSSDMSGATALPVSSLTASGTNTVSLTGLSPNTTYYATFGLTNTLGNGAAHVVSFTTETASTHPRGTLTASADVNTATLAVTLSSLGDGASSCDLYAVLTPTASGLAKLSKKLGTRTATGACSFEVSPLSSEAEYSIALFATNNLGYGLQLASGSVTTLAKPEGELGTGVYADGLVQAKFNTKADTSSAILTASGATRVPGVAMASVSATQSTYGSNGYTNPYDGAKFFWNEKNTTFGYAGEMYFEAGKTYTFGKSFDDGVMIKVDGTQILNHGTWNSTTTATYTPSSSGWKSVDIRVWDGDGGKGPYDGWSAFTGTAWNTAGVTDLSSDSVASWTPFMADAGAPLRCVSGLPSLVSIGTISESGSDLVVPVSIDSYDEDNVLTVYVTTTEPADGEFSSASAVAHDFSGWTSAAGATPAIELGQSQNVTVSGLSAASGATVYAVARLTNARTGYDVCSVLATHTMVGGNTDTAPTFTAEATGVSAFGATISVNLSNLGQGSTYADLEITLNGDTRTPRVAATGVTTYEFTGLSANTGYTATIKAKGSNGLSSTKTVTFTTPVAVVPSGTVTVSNVGYTGATATVSVDSVGDETGTVAVSLEISTSSGFSGATTVSGSSPYTLSGLAAGTKYYLRATFTGSVNGLVGTAETSFTTAAYGAPALGGVTYTATYDTITLSVPVTALGDGSSWVDVVVTWNGGSSKTVRVTATGTATFVFDGLSDGTTYAYSVLATNEQGKTAETSGSASTAAYGAPALGSVSYTATHKTLTFTVPVTSLGAGASSATVSVALNGETKTASVADGSASVVFEDLDASTDYTYTVTVTNDRSKTAETTGTATTAAFPIALGSALGTVADDGTNATISVVVTSLNAASATVTLQLDGATIETWNITEAQTLTKTLVVSGGSHTFLFTATAGGETVTADGTFTATAFEGWFHVDLTDAGYASFPDVSNVATPGGSWASTEMASTYSAAAQTVAFSSSDDATSELRYTPTHASATGTIVKVEGRVVASPYSSSPAIPSPVPLAGISFQNNGSAVSPVVLVSGAWQNFGTTVTEDAMVDWIAEFDFTVQPPLVRYTVDGTAGDWTAMASGDKISAVVYVGTGAFGSFRGSYVATTNETIEIVKPFFKDSTENFNPLSFPSETSLGLTINNAKEGVYYTLFASDTLDKGSFKAVGVPKATHGASVKVLSEGDLELVFETGDAKTKFARIVASDEPFAVGDSLPADTQE